MLFKEMLKEGVDILKQNSIENAEYDAKLLAMWVFDISMSDVIMCLNDQVDDNKRNTFFEKINKRATHYPCQYIIGTAGFMGHEFNVAENVLIPRPETELLVEKAIKIAEDNYHNQNIKVLDMCTGSGCIGISFLLGSINSCKVSNVTLADISEAALELSKKNAFKLCNEYGIRDEIIDVVKTDLFSNINKTFDIIMSNPPYIPSEDIEELMDEVKLYEPKLALDGDKDGLLFYRQIAKTAKEYLHEKGYLLFEIGYDQYNEIYSILVNNGYKDIELIKDYAGLDRIVVAHL